MQPVPTAKRPAPSSAAWAVVRAELAALAARPLLVLLPVLVLAATPWLAWASTTGDSLSLAASIRGTTGAVLMFVLPAWAGAIATGVFSTGASRSALHRGIWRSGYAAARLLVALLLTALAGVAVVLSSAGCLAAAGTSQELVRYERPPAGAVIPEQAAVGRDGRYWLLPTSDPASTASLRAELPASDDGLRLEISFVQGVTPPDRATAGPPLGQPGLQSVPLRVMLEGQEPAPELYRDSARLIVQLPASPEPASVQLVHGGSEFSAGLRASDIRYAGDTWPGLAGLWLLLLGGMIACIPAVACGLAFSVLMSRGTGLLAVACVLMVGWLAPLLEIGAKPALVREAEAALPTSRVDKEAEPEQWLEWYPALATPGARRLVEAGEMPRLVDVTGQLWSVPWLALVLLGAGLLQLRLRDYGDWQDAGE